jgi:hypothetical protein
MSYTDLLYLKRLKLTALINIYRFNVHTFQALLRQFLLNLTPISGTVTRDPSFS